MSEKSYKKDLLELVQVLKKLLAPKFARKAELDELLKTLMENPYRYKIDTSGRIYSEEFPLYGKWQINVTAPQFPDPELGSTRHSLQITLKNKGTFEGIWKTEAEGSYSEKKIQIEGQFFCKHEDNAILSSIRLQGMMDQHYPFTFDIPIDSRLGENYMGTDQKGRTFYLKFLQEFEDII